MKREEFESQVQRLFDEGGQDVAQELMDAGGDVEQFMHDAAAGVGKAQHVEALFGRGRRRWDIHFDEGMVHFDRLEYHEIPSGTWDRMVESFTVPYPALE